MTETITLGSLIGIVTVIIAATTLWIAFRRHARDNAADQMQRANEIKTALTDRHNELMDEVRKVDPALLDFTFNFVRDAANALSISRTEKGGLALLPSQANQSTNANWAFIDFPAALRDFIFARAEQGIRIALHMATIRPALAATGGPHDPLSYFLSQTSPTANRAWDVPATTGPRPGVPAGASGLLRTVGYDPATLEINAPQVVDLATTGWAGAKPANGAGTFHGFAGTGRRVALGADTRNKGMGIVLYRAKAEYLPACKRYKGVGGTPAQEYAAAYAADVKQFVTRDFGVGGRFEGDKLTVDPAGFA